MRSGELPMKKKRSKDVEIIVALIVLIVLISVFRPILVVFLSSLVH